MSNCVTKALEDLEKTKATVSSWDGHGATVEILLASDEFKALDARVSVGHGIGSLNGVLVSINVKKANEVVPLLRALRQKGYKVVSHDDYAELGRRTYRMALLPSTAPELLVSIFVPVGEAGAACKFVEVGKKEVPVYELKCEDGATVPTTVDL